MKDITERIYRRYLALVPMVGVLLLGELTESMQAGSGFGTVKVVPEIAMSGTRNFGVVQEGLSKTGYITLRNQNYTPVTVTKVSMPAGYSGNWTGTIAGYSSVRFPVTFRPAKAGRYWGYVVVSTNLRVFNRTKSFSMRVYGSGKKAPPAQTRVLRISGKQDYGEVKVNSSRWGWVYLHNDGNSTMTVSSLSLPAGFTSSFTKERKIPARSNSRIAVYFRPKQERFYKGYLRASANYTAGTASLQISGRGIKGVIIIDPLEKPIIRTSGKLDFGSQPVNTTTSRPVTVKNVGLANLVVNTITVPPGFATTFRGPVTIAPGKSFGTYLKFAPTGIRSYNGQLVVRSNANNVGLGQHYLRISAAGSAPLTGKPDSRIRRSNSGWVGNGIINKTGARQSITGKTRVARKAKKVFYIETWNRGTAADTFRIHGSKGGSKFRVRYYHIFGGVTRDVTASVVRGTFTTGTVGKLRNAGLIKMEVIPLRRAVKGSKKTCTVTVKAGKNAKKSDTVKGVVAVN